jgi:hypothetical protein
MKTVNLNGVQQLKDPDTDNYDLQGVFEGHHKHADWMERRLWQEGAVLFDWNWEPKLPT